VGEKTKGIVMSEKPKTGEWWETEDGDRMFIVGYRRCKQIVFETTAGIDWVLCDTTTWRHLPDCTGFDWVEQKPEVYDARRILEQIALSVGVDPLGVDSSDLAEMIVLANKKREQNSCRQIPPEFTGREKDLLEAIANLRDNMDRIATRVINLEQRMMPYQTIGGSVR
jgi:hypothetical protein